MNNLDKTEREILRILQQDANLPVAELAERVNLSTTPCWKRIKRLESEGIIRKRVVLVDADQVNLPISVFVTIQTKQHSSEWLKNFADTVASFPEVMELYRMSGETDYLMRVQVQDIQAFDQFYKQLVSSVDGLSNVTSSFAMEQIKYTTALPI